MKRVWLSLVLFVINSLLLLAIPQANVSFAQSFGDICGDQDSGPSGPCDAGLSCQDPYGEGTKYECRPILLPLGAKCNVSETKCQTSQICSPDSPGSDTGTCKQEAEGIQCSPATKDCGAETTTPIVCTPDADKGGSTCQRVRCDLANGDADCAKIKPAFYCTEEAGGSFCSFETGSNRSINVRIVINENFKVPEDVEIPFKYPVELRKGDAILKTTYFNKIIRYSKGTEIKFSESIRLEDVSAGSYKVCFSATSKCVDTVKQLNLEGDATIAVTPCDIGVDTTKENCENTPDPAPGPCADGLLDSRGHCTSFNTGLGKISTDPAGFIRSLFGILLAISGAVAILLIIRAGYKIMASEGRDEQLKEGREQLISAIVGLLFLIFSLVFLQVIGFDILRIPEITGSSDLSKPIGNNNLVASDCLGVYQLGDTGRCVKLLQQELFLDPADGNYDQRTEDAVRKYQSENGIYSDGELGPCTMGKLRGHDVDPICKGPLDDATIRKFQKEKGLKVDGSFGYCTYLAVVGLPITDNCR